MGEKIFRSDIKISKIRFNTALFIHIRILVTSLVKVKE